MKNIQKVKVLYSSLIDFSMDSGPCVNERTFLKYTSRMDNIEFSVLTLNYLNSNINYNRHFNNYDKFPEFIRWLFIRVLNVGIFLKAVK